MMRPDGKYTQLEARLLDLALVLHAEHGGGNNSTFTMHVVTSSGTDTYSAISASLGSLKGPKHGGANLKVMEMFQDLKAHVTDWNNRDAIRSYLTGLLNREGFDHSGLIYGLGHAVYTVSDPRARILKKFAEMLSNEKQMHDELWRKSQQNCCWNAARQTREFVQTLIFTAALCMRCWAFRWNCIRQFLRLQELQAGQHIGLRN